MPEDLILVKTGLEWIGGAESSLPISNEADSFAFEFHCWVPSCAVEQLSLVSLDAGNWWESPSIEDTAGIDQDMALRLCDAVRRLNLHVPKTLRFVPRSADYFVFQLDVFHQLILFGKVSEILVDPSSY